jgi:hypothetical protein
MIRVGDFISIERPWMLGMTVGTVCRVIFTNNYSLTIMWAHDHGIYQAVAYRNLEDQDWVRCIEPPTAANSMESIVSEFVTSVRSKST